MKQEPYRIISPLRLSSYGVEDLEHLHRAAYRFNVEKIRFTPGGQLAVAGLADDDIPAFTALLERFMQPMVDTNISALFSCPGCSGCRHGLADTAAFADRIVQLELGPPLPAKLKIGVAGCRRCCTMPRLRDIGLIAAVRGYDLYFGGNGGARPRINDCIGANLTADEAIACMRAALAIYRLHAKPGIRTSRFIEEMGIDVFREKVKKERPLDPSQRSAGALW